MKAQDLIFLITILFIAWRRSSQLTIIIGLACLILAIPLFGFWIFFTAERLTMYAAGFFLLAIGQMIFSGKMGQAGKTQRVKVRGLP